MAKIITLKKFRTFAEDCGVDTDEHDNWSFVQNEYKQLPLLDLDAVRECLEIFGVLTENTRVYKIGTGIEIMIDMCAPREFFEKLKNIKATAILKQLESIKEEVK